MFDVIYPGGKNSNKEIHFVVKFFFYVRFAQVQVMK
jgi:hypothetical protein